MSDRFPCPDASPFAVVEQAYVQLSTGPNALAVDGTTIAGLPDRAVPLVELRTRLLRPCCGHATAETALQLLLERARRDGEAWTVGLIGVLLPGLRRAVAPLAAACPGRRADLEAEMLAGLLLALDRVPPGRPRPAGWLIGRAFDAAKQLHRREVAEGANSGGQELPDTSPGRPAGNPEVLLARAVGCGVLRRRGADRSDQAGAAELGRRRFRAGGVLQGGRTAPSPGRDRAGGVDPRGVCRRSGWSCRFQGCGSPPPGSPARPEAGTAPPARAAHDREVNTPTDRPATLPPPADPHPLITKGENPRNALGPPPAGLFRPAAARPGSATPLPAAPQAALPPGPEPAGGCSPERRRRR